MHVPLRSTGGSTDTTNRGFDVATMTPSKATSATMNGSAASIGSCTASLVVLGPVGVGVSSVGVGVARTRRSTM
jgi:hypothetical protein